MNIKFGALISIHMVRKEIEAMAKKVLKKVLEDKKYLEIVLQDIKNKDENVRYADAEALKMLSEENPKFLYPHWGFLVELLDSTNTYHKIPAIFTIANMAKVDTDGNFEKIIDKYYNLLNDRSIIITRYIAQYSGIIAKAKPKLQTRITEKLLSIDNTHHDPKHLDLIKGDIIDSFKEYYNSFKEKNLILEFVKKQLHSTSPSTVKKAKEFLEKINN